MKQMQAFIEKAKNDKELMAKLNTLGASGAEADKIVALAAEHGFSITVEEYQLACESASVRKSGELVEEDLDSVAGGATQNRWDPEVCNKYTRTHYYCVGFFSATWCDHYSAKSQSHGKYRHVCSMGRFDYVGTMDGYE